MVGIDGFFEESDRATGKRPVSRSLIEYPGHHDNRNTTPLRRPNCQQIEAGSAQHGEIEQQTGRTTHSGSVSLGTFQKLVDRRIGPDKKPFRLQKCRQGIPYGVIVDDNVNRDCFVYSSQHALSGIPVSSPARTLGSGL